MEEGQISHSLNTILIEYVEFYFWSQQAATLPVFLIVAI
jgi:hypothetical protein